MKYTTGPLLLALFLSGGFTARAQWDTFSDTWVATDGLGRALPTYDDVGPPKTNRSVGLFYFLWLNGGTVYDITQILAANPTNPSWGPRWAFHFWGRPLFDYYRSNDRYVLRKHCQMLADAGVDALFFDVSNAYTYDPARQALCEEFDAFRRAGHRVPSLSFLTHSSASNTVQSLYDSFYAPPLFPELWLNWKGRPLMLARAEEVPPALQTFFNFRYSWAWDPGQDKWPWLDHYPQRFGWHESASVAEEIPVCVAQHPTSNIGRSYHGGAEPAPAQRDPALGLCFSEQWSRALAVGAEMTFVTGWNEWIAQRFVAGQDGNPSFLGAATTNGQTYFVDQYNQEFSRDLEPMSGGHGDHYFYQLVANVRRLKGVRPIENVRSRVIRMDDQTCDDWASVRPEFRDHLGDPARRNHPGYDSAVTLLNPSGRNDLAVAKISADATNVYCYIRAAAPLTAPSTNWMLLFIDADTNAQTGWLGYDLVVNRTGVSSNQTTVERHLGGAYGWGNPVRVPMRFAGSELELALPRSLLTNSTFDFKWADNLLQTGDWSDFTLNGDAAPNDRFNYRARLAFVASHALVPAGATWKFDDTGTNRGTTWRLPGYDDRLWRAGPAQLGFGDGDELTLVASNRQVTTYFRRTFHATPGTFTNLTLRLLRDDGGIVYLNGTEVFRSNLRTGLVDYLTFATNAMPADETTNFYSTAVSPALLVPGENLLAVEIHQTSLTSSDLSFDLELLGITPASTSLLAVSNARGASDLTYASARLDGEVTVINGDAAAVTIFWGPADGGVSAGAWSNRLVLDARGYGGFSVLITNLAPGSSYYYRGYASNALDEVWSERSAPFSTLPPAPAILVPAGANWRYFDQTNDLGVSWRSNAFSDATWRSGPARLGFGNDGEITKIASNKQWATYFRRAFYVPDPARLPSLTARLSRDDGAVIYLNGAEIWRDTNMPAGVITNQTPALTALGGASETNWLTLDLQPSSLGWLAPGWNLLAAEVHQSSLASSDLGFDFELAGTQLILQSPALAIAASRTNTALFWPADAGLFTLYTATNLASPVWTRATNVLVLTNNQWLAPLPLPASGRRYYRLQAP